VVQETVSSSKAIGFPSVTANKGNRPWMTELCERILGHWGPGTREPLSTPLPRVPQRLLVVKVFGMGDGVLIRSLIEHLKARNLGLEIGVLLGPATRESLTLGSDFWIHEYIQRKLTPRTLLHSLREIRRRHYDAILNFEQASTAGSAFLAATGIPLRVGFMPTVESPKGRFLSHGERFQEGRSMWRSFIRLAQLIDPGLSDQVLPVPLKCGAAAKRWAQEWLTAHLPRCPAIAIHLGSQDLEFRRWPLERFVQFAERVRGLGLEPSIILTGTAPERPLIRGFIDQYSGHAADASHSGSLEKTAALLERCQLLVSNDTGIMHLAAAMGTPTVGLFGPNSPRYWAPIGPRATFVYDTKVACSPCLNLYANRWPLECANPEKSRCMLDISVDSVLNAARGVITGAWLGNAEAIDGSGTPGLH
jgi:ADP-heptose:LPS heptosyltransferase